MSTADVESVGNPQPTTELTAEDNGLEEKELKEGEAKQKKVRRRKKLNIATVKFHSLGHYPSTIRFLGPSDLYSTEWVKSFKPSLTRRTC